MIDDKLKAAIERALKNGLRVQLKGMKDGSVKAQIIKAEELKKCLRGQDGQSQKTRRT